MLTEIKRSKLARVVALSACTLLPAAYAQHNPSAPIRVSLVQLLVNPAQFDGKLVTVYGYLSMSREGDLLYLQPSDADNAILSNAIWIHRTEQMGKDRMHLNRKYVVVTGICQIGFREQLGTPSNGIRNVHGVGFWSDPNNPINVRIGQMPGVSSGP
jgi:hypothetical protein